LWKKLVPEVDFPAAEGFNFKYGDIIITRELPLNLVAGPNSLLLSPYSVVRVHGMSPEGSELAIPVPELLFGEAMFFGDGGEVRLPGFRLECSKKTYMTVDEEKYSIAASIVGEQTLVPAAGGDPVKIAEGTYLEMSSDGETGDPEPMIQEDIDLYKSMVIKDEEIKANILTSSELYVIETLNEFWNRDRLEILIDGKETPQGLAVAGGGAIEKEPEITTTIEAFGQDGEIKTKSLSFSAAVEVSKAAGEAPQLSEMTVGGVKAGAGDTVNLEYKNLEDRQIALAGKIAAGDENLWKIFVKVNDDEFSVEGVKTFTYLYRVSQDFANLPSVFGVTVADRPADVYLEEFALVTRENLEGGKLIISGSAEPGVNKLNYNIEIIARDKKEETEISLGKYTVDLDLTELSSVEVSVDNGSGWEKAQGTTEWTFSMRPNDGDVYKVKIFAFDVMDNKSDEQFEPYTFKYSYKTANELLRETFETQMRALMDKDKATFLRAVSQDFSTGMQDLRDYNELENSIEERFLVGPMNIKYSISDVDAYLDTKQGTLDFYWSGASSDNFYAIFNYVFEEGEWKLQEVIDEDTFLRLSRIVSSIRMESEETGIIADGESATGITARCFDLSGNVVADGIEVDFSANTGTVEPDRGYTLDGVVETTYRAPVNPGSATITAGAPGKGGVPVSSSISITLYPLVSSIELTADDDNLTADGEETTTITASCYDINGNKTADGVRINFSAEEGSVNPAFAYTSGGTAQTTYKAPTTQGTDTVTAEAADVPGVDASVRITLDPVAPPPPPDGE